MSDDLTGDVCRYYARADQGSHFWSVALYVTLDVPILLGIFTFILGLDIAPLGTSISNKHLSSIVGAISTAFVALGTLGGFERKRAANRRARTALDVLRIRIRDKIGDKSEHVTTLETILADLDGSIVKMDKAQASKPSSPCASRRRSESARVKCLQELNH